MLKQIKKMLDSLQTAKAQQAGGGVEWREGGRGGRGGEWLSLSSC